MEASGPPHRDVHASLCRRDSRHRCHRRTAVGAPDGQTDTPSRCAVRPSSEPWPTNRGRRDTPQRTQGRWFTNTCGRSAHESRYPVDRAYVDAHRAMWARARRPLPCRLRFCSGCRDVDAVSDATPLSPKCCPYVGEMTGFGRRCPVIAYKKIAVFDRPQRSSFCCRMRRHTPARSRRACRWRSRFNEQDCTHPDIPVGYYGGRCCRGSREPAR